MRSPRTREHDPGAHHLARVDGRGFGQEGCEQKQCDDAEPGGEQARDLFTHGLSALGPINATGLAEQVEQNGCARRRDALGVLPGLAKHERGNPERYADPNHIRQPRAELHFGLVGTNQSA
jgi:hypothetical protein